MNFDFLKTSGALLTNARIRWLPDCFGEYQPYEIVAFDRPVFVPAGWERTGCNSDNSYNDDIIEVINTCVDNSRLLTNPPLRTRGGFKFCKNKKEREESRCNLLHILDGGSKQALLGNFCKAAQTAIAKPMQFF